MTATLEGLRHATNPALDSRRMLPYQPGKKSSKGAVAAFRSLAVAPVGRYNRALGHFGGEARQRVSSNSPECTGTIASTGLRQIAQVGALFCPK